MTEPRKTTRSRAASGAQPEEAATPPAATPPPPAPAAAPTPPTPPPPPPAASTPAPAPAQEGPPPGAQVAAALTGVASTLKQRLSGPELLLGGGALLIFGASFVVFSILLGTLGASESSVIVAGVLLVIIGLERTQTQGFGGWYKVALVLLGAVLLLGAMYSLLYTFRHYASSLSGLDWLSMLCWWAGGVIAGVGSWLAFRVKA
jgi:hypothetical protein